MNEFVYTQYKRVLTVAGDIMLALKPPACGAQQMLEMSPYIKSGNVIGRFYDCYLDGIFIPGEFTHSGIIVSRDIIIHSISEGVKDIHPWDFVKDTDGFIILEPPYENQEAIEAALNEARWHLAAETPYDFTFKDATALYCHEFTVRCLEAGGIRGIKKTRKSFGVWPFRFSRDLYLADNIIECCMVSYRFEGGKK